MPTNFKQALEDYKALKSEVDVSCVAQGSTEWYKARLGKITSSNVHYVMKAAKATKSNPNPEPFSDTAKGYLYQVAAERNLTSFILNDDDNFQTYLERVELSSKAIRYGQEMEDNARVLYSKRSGNEVVQAGFINHKELANYGDSPDGIIVDKDGMPIGALEIKCPKPDTFIRYKANIVDAETLKQEKPEYYWQCQSHCECNNVQWCDFVFYDFMQKNGYVCIHIERNEEDIALMKERVVLANQFIDNLLK